MLLAGPALAATPDAGTTIVVRNEVTLKSGTGTQALSKGTVVHQDEIIVTGAGASAEVELLDKTKLAIGPESKIVLDKFVYDASASPGSISVNLSKGTFRFLTGIAPKNAYEIKTPTASLGIRGTIFDVYVGANGETAVLLFTGAIQTCNAAGSCRLQDTPGTILYVNSNGVISLQSRCEKPFLQQMNIERAFPFVGKALAVDPVQRMSLRDFECGAVNKPPVTVTEGITQPSPSSASPEVPDISPPELAGLAIAGGLVIAVPIIESKPVSP